MFIRDMFLYKNRLVLNIANPNKDEDLSHSDDLTLTRIYDVSNPENQKLVSKFSRDRRVYFCKNDRQCCVYRFKLFCS